MTTTLGALDGGSSTDTSLTEVTSGPGVEGWGLGTSTEASVTGSAAAPIPPLAARPAMTPAAPSAVAAAFFQRADRKLLLILFS
jgi:hypothetical protein